MARPKLEKPTKDAQVMTRMTGDTYEELQRIGVEMDRSVSWILNDLAVKFVAEHKGKRKS
jgi:hypothetical protein